MSKTHNPIPVKGYKPQSEATVDLVNNNKKLEEMNLRLFDILSKMENVDKRWLAIGKTHIEQGWMAINRAIFKPERVKLDED